jgi:hypothetical protein
MDDLWMAIAPSTTSTRLMLMHGAAMSLLSAELRRDPQHHRALSTLLEALALWQGARIRAALVVDEAASLSGTNLYHDAFDDGPRTPLYTIEAVWDPRRGRRRDRSGVAEFRDLRRILLEEVAR